MRKVAVIPARYASSRFPGKPLVDIYGKSMVRRVYERTTASGLFEEVLVATDDQRIFNHVNSWNGQVKMTSMKHISGTERIGEIARDYEENVLFMNVQGDEPFIKQEQLASLMNYMEENKSIHIGTLAKPLSNLDEIFNPDIVKVVRSKSGKALYFSRHAIPFQQGRENADWAVEVPYFKHIGLYAYYRDTLLELTDLPPGKLEAAESLEQLRWLEYDYQIGVALTEEETISIDRPEDIDRLLKYLESSGFKE